MNADINTGEVLCWAGEVRCGRDTAQAERNVTFLGKRSIHISACASRVKYVLRSKTIPARMECALHQGRHVKGNFRGVNKDSDNSYQRSIRWDTWRWKRNLSTKESGFRGSGPTRAAHR